MFIVKLHDEYFILAVSGVGSEPINDVKVAELILVDHLGGVKNDDGVYMITRK